MNVRIERKAAFKVIGMTLSVLLSEERKKKLITALHEGFSKRVYEIEKQINPTVEYGIFIDPPNYNPDTDPFTWIAGVEVDDISNPPEEMEGLEFPGHLYAITTYQGPKGEAGNLYGDLYSWVSQSEYQIAADYGIEVYSDHSDDIELNHIKMELCFPIKKKSVE